jgi:hypothetical protein
MTRLVWCALWLVVMVSAILSSGCVVPYDPASTGRLGIGDPSPVRPVAGPTKQEAKVATQMATAPTSVAQPPVPAQPAPAAAAVTLAPDSPASRQMDWVVELLSGKQEKDKALAAHFAPEFLDRVPVPQVRRVVNQWRRDQFAGGTAEISQISTGENGNLTALVRGRATDRFTQVRLGVDDQGRINTLWLAPVLGGKIGEIAKWSDLDDRLAALPGAASLAAHEITAGGSPREVHVYGGDRRLAIGSTMKDYIAGAVAEAVADGRLKWDDIITIQDNLKSLPTGRMQLLQEGAEVKVVDALESMISISDNTAADHLLFRVGRDRVEDFMRRYNADPQRNMPFLSTMEMFKLKLTPDRELTRRYLAADEAGRRAMLAPGGAVEQATISPLALMMWKVPYLINELEWFATTPEMNAAMGALHTLEQKPGLEPLAKALRINPGVPFDSRAWRSVAYKGGSEPGVLNMTWLLERADGRWFTLSVTWNDPTKAVDIQRMTELAGAAVALLAEEK